MLKKHLIFFLFSFILVSTNACTSLSQLKRISYLQGEYQVQQGSDPSCKSGQLSFVGDKDGQGIRINHHIYIGPSKDFIEPATSKSCRIINKFSMLKHEITVQTIVDECPSTQKDEEGESTQILNFRNKEITYTNIESGYNCIFLKQ